MVRKRRKRIEYHLSEDELDRKLAEADDDEMVRRLAFLKNVYQGDTIEEAANRVGRSESTGDRWADRWNDTGLDGLAPSFGGGRPPKLDENQRHELIELLRDDQPWRPQEIRHLLKEEFDVEYSPTYLSEFLGTLGLSYSISRTRRPSRPGNGGEVSEDTPEVSEDSRPHNGQGERGWGWEFDEDARTDGGATLGLVDGSHRR